MTPLPPSPNDRPPQPQAPPPPPQWGPPPPQWYGAPAGGPPRPPYQAPDPRQVRRSPWPLVIGLVMLFVVVVMAIVPIAIGVTAGAGATSSATSFLPFGPKIAVLEIDGILGEGPAYGADTKRLREAVRKWAEDSSIKGMIVRINSPGGAVSATQDLHKAIADFAGEKPVYASMGDIAASGGYYVAMGADRIFANAGTMTGSVGVIMSFWGYRGLTDKMGLEPRTIKSGQFKDIGSGARPMTEEERALLDTMVKDVYEQFYNEVYAARFDNVRHALAEQSGRKPRDVAAEEVDGHLRGLCDGRILSGNQALGSGLVDELGTFDEVVEAMKQKLGVQGDVRLIQTPKPHPGLFGLAEKASAQLQGIAPGSARLEFRFEM